MSLECPRATVPLPTLRTTSGPESLDSTLAANLLDSLPAVLSDEDEGIAEALRRDTDLDANPDRAISLEQLGSQIQSRRGRCNWNFIGRSPLEFECDYRRAS